MPRKKEKKENFFDSLHPEIKKSVWATLFLGLTLILILAAFNEAGPWGDAFFSFLSKVLGAGYFLLPTITFLMAFSFVMPDKKRAWGLTISASLIFIFSGLGLMDLISAGSGGWTGSLIGVIRKPFGLPASLVFTLTLMIISFLVVLNRPVSLKKFWSFLKSPIKKKGGEEPVEVKLTETEEPEENEDSEESEDEDEEENEDEEKADEQEKKTEASDDSGRSNDLLGSLGLKRRKKFAGSYNPPPLKLLASKTDKPTIGDLRANANIIKRTLESFGIAVDMGEIQVGPTVTRYTLKPAEGVKLSRITALYQDLALALAAHPIRIEAPIPGKSLVGIEVPNKSAAVVRLGSLINDKGFQKSDYLNFVLGRNVSGDPIFPDIAKMPHLLIAGATGSGKSITIHTMLISLLYKNSPETLRLIMIDPKKVELSVYNGIPHLIAPVITDNKKSVGSLKWAINEMDRRYELLLEAGARDIKSYNKSAGEPLPYILIVIDELADLMASYGREVEGAIIRLAQMSRATGIHLVVSTQRPSVEVITGLIKANITARIALQVASQIDSRTILDMAGAEKLLGNGDLLFLSPESSKPQRIQGAYLTESEIKKVVDYIKTNNEALENGGAEEIDSASESVSQDQVSFEDFAESEEEDELYDEAVKVVRAAKKASASLLQRRLRVGYARAARLLDMMEERGIVGPADGAKPREVFINED